MTGFHWDYDLLAAPIFFGIMLHLLPGMEKEGCWSGFTGTPQVQIGCFQIFELEENIFLAASQVHKRAQLGYHTRIYPSP